MKQNERIKELARQAGYSGGFDDPEEIEQIGNDFSYFDIDKFADLIIRECIGVCRSQRDPSTINYSPSERTVEAIRMHFSKK
jgi:hypothetical protein